LLREKFIRLTVNDNTALENQRTPNSDTIILQMN
jgi:hypothetical protein